MPKIAPAGAVRSSQRQFTTPFGKYVCEGDSITLSIDGFDVTARIVRDNCGDSPDQRQDGFWPSRDEKDAGYCPPELFDKSLAVATRAMDTWKRDEWFYCGVVLSVSKNGVELDDYAASLWGIECNYPDSDNAYLMEVANELLPEALDVARAILTKLREA